MLRQLYESWSPLRGHLPTVQHENVPRIRKQTLFIFFAAKEKAAKSMREFIKFLDLEDRRLFEAGRLLTFFHGGRLFEVGRINTVIASAH